MIWTHLYSSLDQPLPIFRLLRFLDHFHILVTDFSVRVGLLLEVLPFEVVRVDLKLEAILLFG